MYDTRLEQSLPRVREAIAAAASRAGRDAGEVGLVAVTKGHPLAAVHAAMAAGLEDLGENRIEELEEKTAILDGGRVRWHMIGHVQGRKAGRAVAATDLIHSVDSRKLAARIGRAAQEAGRSAAVLFQVNVAGEEQKYGFEPEMAVESILEVSELAGVDGRGLMTMAPFTEDESILRRTFVRLRELSETIRRHRPEFGSELSMGMTNDLGIAIEEGSTMVRVGTALFGRRSVRI